MRKIGENDAVEMWSAMPSEPRSAVLSHERRVMDARARWMMQMVQAWGAMTFLSDAMHDAHDDKTESPKTAKRPTKQEVVMIAAELVQAAWDEATHRGWIVDVEGYQ